METTYYMIADGKQIGPFVAAELKYHGLTPETYVWREGMPNWVKAGTLPELAGLYATAESQPHYSQPHYSQPTPQQPPYSGYSRPESYGRDTDNSYYREPIPHTNWLPWAIVTTVLGCFSGCVVLILGILAIVKANKANNYFNSGNYDLGTSANSTAKTLVICGLVLVGIGLIGAIVVLSNPTLRAAFQSAMLP